MSGSMNLGPGVVTAQFPVGEPATLSELLQQRAAYQAQKLSYTFLNDRDGGEMTLTYAELDARVRVVAAWLQEHAAVGDRALMIYPPGIDFVIAFLGCLYSGVIAVPVSPPHPTRLAQSLPRLQSIFQSAAPKVAITTTSLAPTFEAASAHLPGFSSIHWQATDALTADLAQAWKPTTITSEMIAFLQYTSGSTALPKGVIITHGNLMANERMIQKGFSYTPDSTMVGWLPLYHDMGLIGVTLQPLYLGARCIQFSPMLFLQRPITWLQTITKYQARTSGGPNFAYELCVRRVKEEQRAALDLSSWELAFNGAEPVRAQTLERFIEAFAPCGFRREAFEPCYGLAEATLFVTGGLATEAPVYQNFQAEALEQRRAVPVDDATDASAVRMLVGCGRPWLEQEVVIADPDTSMRCAEDRIGEIWIKGPNVTQGYWRRPEENARTFGTLADTGEGPFLRTGDLGCMYKGELFVVGRIKDLIIIDGRNHYPQDIELTVEQSHPAIRSGCSAAFALDAEGQERLVVVAEIDRQFRPNRSGSTDDGVEVLQEITRAVRQAISDMHDIPVWQTLLLKTGTIPKTSSGKIQRHACRSGFLAKSLDVWEV